MAHPVLDRRGGRQAHQRVLEDAAARSRVAGITQVERGGDGEGDRRADRRGERDTGEEAVDTRTARGAVTKMIADMTWGPTIIVTARGNRSLRRRRGTRTVSAPPRPST